MKIIHFIMWLIIMIMQKLDYTIQFVLERRPKGKCHNCGWIGIDAHFLHACIVALWAGSVSVFVRRQRQRVVAERPSLCDQLWHNREATLSSNIPLSIDAGSTLIDPKATPAVLVFAWPEPMCVAHATGWRWHRKCIYISYRWGSTSFY